MAVRLRFLSSRAAGFTLMEMVMVIVLVGIIAGMLLVFLRPAVSGYVDSRRRAELSDNADVALRLIQREIRSAVPNSIRTPNDQCFELVPTLTGGRYRTAPDTVNEDSTCPGSGVCSAPLDTAQPTEVFDVLTNLAVLPSPGDWVVVGNQDANDVYTGETRAALTGVAAPPRPGFGAHRFSIQSHQFPIGYDSGRFSVVNANAGQPAVFYVCQNPGVDARGYGTGTLYRLTRPFEASYPTACPAVAGAAVVARNVSNCSFTYSPSAGATQQRGFVEMLLELTQANETAALSYGTHVDNVP